MHTYIQADNHISEDSLYMLTCIAMNLFNKIIHSHRIYIDN